MNNELPEIPNKKKHVTISVAKKIALIAVCAALIEGGKLALSFVPNVEVVTLLCALFGYSFGPLGVISVYVFVAIEPLLYGFNTWVISYFIYWPLVSFIFMLLGKRKVRNIIVITLTAVLLTAFFGVLTSLIDIGLLTGSYDNFFKRFAIYYANGAIFYINQIVCNLILFPVAFKPLSRILEKVVKL